MIISFCKVFAVAEAKHKNRLLNVLKESQAVHLISADRAAIEPTTDTNEKLKTLKKALSIIKEIKPKETLSKGPDITLSPVSAAGQIVELANDKNDILSKIRSIKRTLRQNALFGATQNESLLKLKDAGISINFFLCAPSDISKFKGGTVTELQQQKKQSLIAVITDKTKELLAPKEAIALPKPSVDNPTLMSQLSTYIQRLSQNDSKLGELANLKNAIFHEQQQLEDALNWEQASRHLLTQHNLVAVQGWIPKKKISKLTQSFNVNNLPFALRIIEPLENETPPTLVQYNAFSKPMSSLFKILGTVPGYRESDVSVAFSIALPIFAAMLIADGGYGLFLMAAAVLLYKFASHKVGVDLPQLLLIIGTVAFLYGLAISSFFGVGDRELSASDGIWNDVGFILAKLKLINGSFIEETIIKDIMRLSFLLGTIHMTFARLWRGFQLFPSISALCQLGWAFFLWGILLLVYTLVLEDAVHPAMVYLLVLGGSFAVLFAKPGKNPFKMIGAGLAGFPLAALGILSDTISYIRLMAVGLASTILAATFNELASQVAHSTGWFFGSLVLILGHSLNIGLAIIALFAHGVRLNMLEFSNHLEMTWNGYPYKPFRSIFQRNNKTN